LILAERAQYESPRAVPGEMVAPFCPNFTVLLRPVAGLVTIFVNLFSIMVQSDIRRKKQVWQGE
jgi:hypothetical protein